MATSYALLALPSLAARARWASAWPSALPRDVASLVVRDVIVVAGAGVVIGVPAALMVARLLESLMFGVSTRDVTTLAFSAALLVAVAIFAAAMPARRAGRVDPMIALRAE